MSEALRAALLEFDGKALSYLSETSLRFKQAPDYLETLVGLAGDRAAHIDNGATWLIKDHLEKGGAQAPELVAPLLKQLTTEPSWPAALHILQSVRRVDLTGARDTAAFDAMKAYADHPRPFLRAWAMDAMWRMAHAFPDLQADARRAIGTGLNDKAASVRARARQLSKEACE
ncbi:MAG: hypothetical protein HRT82_07070 [Henriciella sp.]|nr:hypothetical protein [Henriciella sp.]